MFNIFDSDNTVNDDIAINDMLSKIGISITIYKITPILRPIKIVCDRKSDIGFILSLKHHCCDQPSIENFHIVVDWTSS